MIRWCSLPFESVNVTIAPFAAEPAAVCGKTLIQLLLVDISKMERVQDSNILCDMYISRIPLEFRSPVDIPANK